MNREELLAAIRKIVGRKFQFSEAYAKKCGGYPTLGANERTYSILTRKYVYIPCRVTFGKNAEGEIGAYFNRYSLYKYFEGVVITKIEYERLFTKDLLKMYILMQNQEHISKKQVEQTSSLLLRMEDS